MKPKFQRKVLENGMTILFEKRDVPVVSIAFAVRAGAIHEAESEKGISHFIEHLLFKGTKTRSAKQIAQEIEKNGGELNGFTIEEAVAYWCKLPSKKLKIGLDVLGDLIQNPLFDEKELEKERKVIFEEIKLYHDNPQMYIFDEIQKSLYTGTMGINIIGTYKTMNSIGREKILKKFREIYAPNNFILCVVGNAEFKDIVKFVESKFGKQKGKAQKQEFALQNQEKTEKRKGLDQANLIFAYHVPTANDKNSYSARVLSCLMAEGMSSRLFSEIREKRNLAYAVKGGSNIHRNFAYNFIYVGTMKENVEKVKKLILEEFEKVAKELTEKELTQIKEQLIGNYYISMEDSQAQMVNLLASEIHGNAREFYEFEKNISQIRLGGVKDMAFKAKEKHSFFALVPED